MAEPHRAAGPSSKTAKSVAETYAETLRPFTHTLPARAGGEDLLNPQRLYDPFAGDLPDNPYAARYAFGQPSAAGAHHMHGFDVEAIRAEEVITT